MDSGALNCPNCGAAVTSLAPQCPYCRALLATVACRRCMGMVFVGTKYCPRCGAPAGEWAVGETTPHPCPRCEARLIRVEVARQPLEECPSCAGLWMAVGVLDRICSEAEAQTAATGLALPTPAPTDEEAIYPRCPECGDPMYRKKYARRSGVLINTCRAHGVWLDRDELRQVLEFIRSGGMDRARAVEKEQLEAARRRLEFERRLGDRGQRPDD